jgi:segregation and condensation protein A
MDSYRIKLPFFTGPFDLLLSLVKAHDVDIYDVEITHIVDQYLAYIELLKLCDLELAGEFLVMAATLVRLKSRTLLPADSFFDADEEDEDLEEQISEIQNARQLIDQLVEYRKYKELSVDLSDRERSQARVFFREKVRPLDRSGEEDEISGDLALLLSALGRVLSFVASDRFYEVVRESWTVEDKMEDVLLRLKNQKFLDVTELFRRCIHKLELIVVFLALLELCKQRRVHLRQSSTFNEIHAFKTEEQLDHVGPEA